MWMHSQNVCVHEDTCVYIWNCLWSHMLVPYMCLKVTVEGSRKDQPHCVTLHIVMGTQMGAIAFSELLQQREEEG